MNGRDALIYSNFKLHLYSSFMVSIWYMMLRICSSDSQNFLSTPQSTYPGWLRTSMSKMKKLCYGIFNKNTSQIFVFFPTQPAFTLFKFQEQNWGMVWGQNIKSIPTHFQVQDNYHTLQSFPQHPGATQVEGCVLLVLSSHLKPTFRIPQSNVQNIPKHTVSLSNDVSCKFYLRPWFARTLCN